MPGPAPLPTNPATLDAARAALIQAVGRLLPAAPENPEETSEDVILKTPFIRLTAAQWAILCRSPGLYERYINLWSHL